MILYLCLVHGLKPLKSLKKFMIIKILDRLGSQEHGLFARILDFITLGIADAGGVRPFLYILSSNNSARLSK